MTVASSASTAAKQTSEADGPAGRLIDAVGGRKVVLCLGSGGVGKTTTSAALAIGLARRGERVVVLTIDPARRLADALGRSGTLDNEPTRVEPTGRGRSRSWSGQLWAAMLDPAATFETVIREEAVDEAQARRIMANPIFANLTSSLSGTNEYMAAEHLHRLHGDDRFDRIVIDTPPSRHAMDFLDSPGRLTRFVDHRLYRSVFAPRHGLLRTINAGAQVMLRLLGRLVGTRLVDDVIEFFADFEGLDAGFRRRATEIESLLTGDDAAYVVITAPREDPLREADWILDNLRRRDRRFHAVIVNRVLPVGRADAVTHAPAVDDRTGGDDPLALNLTQLGALAAEEDRLIDALIERLQVDDGQPSPIIKVHEQLTPVRDLKDLSKLSEEL